MWCQPLSFRLRGSWATWTQTPQLQVRGHKAQGWSSWGGPGTPCPSFQGLTLPPSHPASSPHSFLFPHDLTRQLYPDHQGLVRVGFHLFPGSLFTHRPVRSCGVGATSPILPAPEHLTHARRTAGRRKCRQWRNTPWTWAGHWHRPWLCHPPPPAGTLWGLPLPLGLGSLICEVRRSGKEWPTYSHSASSTQGRHG